MAVTENPKRPGFDEKVAHYAGVLKEAKYGKEGARNQLHTAMDIIETTNESDEDRARDFPGWSYQDVEELWFAIHHLLKEDKAKEQDKKPATEAQRVEITKILKSSSEVPDDGDMLKFAKGRALAVLDKGDLKGAVDSMVADLAKDKTRPAMQVQMIGMMGMDLRNKPGLTEKEVREWIEGFN